MPGKSFSLFCSFSKFWRVPKQKAHSVQCLSLLPEETWQRSVRCSLIPQARPQPSQHSRITHVSNPGDWGECPGVQALVFQIFLREVPSSWGSVLTFLDPCLDMAGRFQQEVVEGPATGGTMMEASICLFRGCCRTLGMCSLDPGKSAAVPFCARDAKTEDKVGTAL